jgi:cysteinyl-tRNA synthetase
VLEPTVEPRATEHIAEMRTLIERLVKNGHAYVAEEHVLFDVPSTPDYGRLSKRPLDEMEAGARVDVAPYKRSPLDFVLWKPSKPGEPSWPSPAGIATPGRPGWHIECSAMSWKHLGEAFDIHGGGIDLVFPHHENEVAQTRCSFGTPAMANVWMHNGFLQVEGEKMSKSLGNFVTINEAVKEWRDGDVLRWAMLSTHYRQPIDWTRRKVLEAVTAIGRFKAAVIGVDVGVAKPSSEVVAALADDLNTPAVMAELHRLERRSLSTNPIDRPAEAQEQLYGSLILLGFDRTVAHATESYEPRGTVREDLLRAFNEAQAKDAGFDLGRVQDQIEARKKARASKNWAESDRIRDELAAMGITLKDNKDGTTTWEVAR